MSRRSLLLPAAGLVLLLGLAGGASAAPRPSNKVGSRDAVAAQIRSAASELSWPALPDFLTAAGYTESRFNPALTNASGRRGVFQLDPDSALLYDLAGVDPALLYDVNFAVVAAAYYTVRLAKYRGPKRLDELTGLDLRRGWAYPSLVDDYDEKEQRSREVRARLEQAEQATGVRVADRLMFPPGWSWIGVPEALRRVGGKM